MKTVRKNGRMKLADLILCSSVALFGYSYSVMVGLQVSIDTVSLFLSAITELKHSRKLALPQNVLALFEKYKGSVNREQHSYYLMRRQIAGDSD